MASRIARLRASARQRRVDRIERAAARRGNELGAVIRERAIAAFRNGLDVPLAINDAASRLADDVTDAMVAAHLRGRLDVVVEVTGQRAARADMLSDAAEFLRRRVELPGAKLESLRELYRPVANTVAADATNAVSRGAADAVRQSIAAGEHVDLGVKRLEDRLTALGVSKKRRAQHLLETLYRTQTQLAYSAGEWNAEQDPAIQEILWGYEYVTAGDDFVRPTHAALDGTRLKANDPMWDTIRAPNGYNCRCTQVRIFNTDRGMHRQRLVPATRRVPLADGGTVEVVPGPDEGFAFNPGKVWTDDLGPISTTLPLSLAVPDRLLLAVRQGGSGGRPVLLREITRAAAVAKSTASDGISDLIESGLVERPTGVHGCRLTEAGARTADLLARACRVPRGTP